MCVCAKNNSSLQVFPAVGIGKRIMAEGYLTSSEHFCQVISERKRTTFGVMLSYLQQSWSTASLTEHQSWSSASPVKQQSCSTASPVKQQSWSTASPTEQQSCNKRIGPTPASFCLFSLFSNTNFTEKTGFSKIRTRIVGAEGEHVDHLSTTTAYVEVFCCTKMSQEFLIPKHQIFWKNFAEV